MNFADVLQNNVFIKENANLKNIRSGSKSSYFYSISPKICQFLDKMTYMWGKK